jgi:hypothetical protein
MSAENGHQEVSRPIPSQSRRRCPTNRSTLVLCDQHHGGMEAPDLNPADLSPQQREARLNTVLADLRAGHSTAAGGLIVGGREAHLLWYATVDAYIAGNWVATILCGQATCERVLGGLVSLNELPGAGIIGPKGWERWGLGNLIKHIRSLGWVPDRLLDDAMDVCEVRKPFGHWRRPLDPGTPGRRVADQLHTNWELDPEELEERLIAADAERAAVTALRLYLGGYGVGPYEVPRGGLLPEGTRPDPPAD